jgi:hypothetical protein
MRNSKCECNVAISLPRKIQGKEIAAALAAERILL